jgi:hypothetical protein
MAVVVYAFIYGKNFFDNPDREYTDFDEFKAVNNYSELSDFLDTMSSQVVPSNKKRHCRVIKSYCYKK